MSNVGDGGYGGSQPPRERRAYFDLDRRLKGAQDRLDEITGTESPVDHGALVGLGDDDHPQYAKQTELAAESSARANADTNLLSQIDAETANRISADALKADITYVDAADGVLQAAIDAEEAARIAADGVLQTAVDDETAARIAADALKADITYVDSEVASVQGAVDAHIADTVDAHDASAVSFDGSGLSPLSQSWHPLTVDDVQDSLFTIIGEIDGRIEAGDVDAIIDALNSWTGGDPTITNDGVFSAGLITADAIAAGAVVTSKLAANSVTTAKLATDAIQSTNYAYTSGNFSDAGSFFDLANGDLRTTGLFVNGSTGDVAVRGDITATALALLLGDGTTVALEADPSPPPGSGVYGDAGMLRFYQGGGTDMSFVWNANQNLLAGEYFALQSSEGYSNLSFDAYNGTTTGNFSVGGVSGTGYSQVSLQGGPSVGVAVLDAYSDLTNSATRRWVQVNGNGNIQVGGGALVLSESGTAAAPILRLGGEGNSGLFRPAENYIGFATGGGHIASVHNGGLALTNGKKFSIDDGTLGDKLQLWSGYTLGIAGSTLYYNSNLYHDFRVGGTFKGRIHNHGFTSYAYGSGWAKLGGVDGSATGGGGTWNGVDSSGGYLLLSQNGYGPVYLRSRGGHNVLIGGNESDTISVGNGTTTVSGWISVSGNIECQSGSQFRSLRSASSNMYTSAGVFVGNGGTLAHHSLWANGVATQWRQGTGVQAIYVRTWDDSAYSQLNAVLWNASSAHQKEDIQSWPVKPDNLSAAANDLAFPSALEAAKKLRPVKYRWKKNVLLSKAPNPRRAEAVERLNKIRKEKGQKKWQEENPDEFIHDCERDPDFCIPDADGRCTQTRVWEEGQLGFIAQEVGEVLPEAAQLDPNTGEYELLDGLALSAVAIGAIQELQAEVEALQAEVAKLAGKK